MTHSSSKVARLGLGLAALGRPGYINLGHDRDLQADYDPARMEARAHNVLEAAWAAGMVCFDAARSYGRAEEFLGNWLRSRWLHGVVVSSKWGYEYTADWNVEAEKHEVKEHSRKQLERQWQETRKHLGEHLDLYQIHSATLETGVLENEAILERLAELKAGGLRIGLTVTGAKQRDTIYKSLEIRRNGERLFDSVQATLNLLEQSATPALQEASAQNMQVMIKETLANGRLTERGDLEADAEGRELLGKQCARLGATPDAFALAFVLEQPWVNVALSGAATVSQLESNLGALQIPLDDEARDACAQMAQNPEAYWQTRSNLPWR